MQVGYRLNSTLTSSIQQHIDSSFYIHKMWHVFIFSWHRRNIEHIAEHGVLPFEAEEAVENAQPPFPREIGDEKHHVWSQTGTGRYLQVIFVFLDDAEVDLATLNPSGRLDFADGHGEVIYVIHAMEMTDRMKRQDRRLRRS